jgi:hypothetical protein
MPLLEPPHSRLLVLTRQRQGKPTATLVSLAGAELRTKSRKLRLCGFQNFQVAFEPFASISTLLTFD